MCQSVERDRQTYLLHSKLVSYQRRVDAAIEIARTALETAANPLLSFSAGKDSIVLLDIAVKAGFKGDLLFFKYGISTDVETPLENVELLKYYAKKHGLKYHILDCMGEVDCWEQCGRFMLFPETAEEKRIFNRTNMDFLKPDVRRYFFKEFPSIYSKVSDLPPAKYNPGSAVKNSLVASGCIINGTVENSVLFKKVFVGNNCVIKNSIILNDVYLGDNTYIENCIVESRDTIRANTRHVGENGVKIVAQKEDRYTR